MQINSLTAGGAGRSHRSVHDEHGSTTRPPLLVTLVATAGLSRTAGQQIVDRFDELAASTVDVQPATVPGGPDGSKRVVVGNPMGWDAPRRVDRLAGVDAAATLSDVVLAQGQTVTAVPVVDPSAPPVAMIGPSAPNGPPVPMAIADESGFKKINRGWIRLWLKSTCSIASGMPWPRIAFDPWRAMSPTISAPTIGTTTTSAPR